MRTKLTLNLDQLEVTSFTTETGKRPKGTVMAQQCTCPTACTCPGCPTCDASCNGTCGATCEASCNGTCAATCNSCAASCNGTCDDCTLYDITCRNIGTCHFGGVCYDTP